MITFLRLEGLALCLAAIVGYALVGGSWWLFLLLILVPDISLAGYLAGPALGATAYNAVHTTIAPLCVLALGVWIGSGLTVQIAAIWLAHIGIDRALGYGLKYQSSFSDTHLGRIGRGNAPQNRSRQP